METELLQKKRKKRKEYLLLTDYECLTQEEIISTVKEMRTNLREIFKKHIGEGNAITPVDLFQQVYGINPSYFDIFKKGYWWNVLKKVMHSLRSDDTLFIINKGTKLFVLQSQKEANDFKNQKDREIARLRGLKIKADSWVRNKKWQKLK